MSRNESQHSVARWYWGENVIQGGVMALLHRVVFYGDHKERIRDLGDLMGFKCVEEGGLA